MFIVFFIFLIVMNDGLIIMVFNLDFEFKIGILVFNIYRFYWMFYNYKCWVKINWNYYYCICINVRIIIDVYLNIFICKIFKFIKRCGVLGFFLNKRCN